MNNLFKKEMRVNNAGLYHSIGVVATNYKGYVITNVQNIGTECFKIQIRSGEKGEHKFKFLKSRCCLTSWTTSTHPVESVVSCTKKVEKIFPKMPKILIHENVGDYLVIIYEWGEGEEIQRMVGSKNNAVKSYGNFLKGVESLGIWPRDHNLANIVYDIKNNFAYYCDFGAMSFYVDGGDERYRKSAKDYKNKIMKTSIFSNSREAFYAGYNK